MLNLTQNNVIIIEIKTKDLHNTMSLSKRESQFPFKPHQWAPLESIPISISGPDGKISIKETPYQVNSTSGERFAKTSYGSLQNVCKKTLHEHFWNGTTASWLLNPMDVAKAVRHQVVCAWHKRTAIMKSLSRIRAEWMVYHPVANIILIDTVQFRQTSTYFQSYILQISDKRLEEMLLFLM